MKKPNLVRELTALIAMRDGGEINPTKARYWMGQISPELVAEFSQELQQLFHNYLTQTIALGEQRSGTYVRSAHERDIEASAREFAREEEERDRRDVARRAGRLVRPALRDVVKLHVDGDSSDFSWRKPLKK